MSSQGSSSGNRSKKRAKWERQLTKGDLQNPDFHEQIFNVLKRARQHGFRVTPGASEYVRQQVSTSVDEGVIRSVEAKVAAAGLVASGLEATRNKVLTVPSMKKGWKRIAVSICNPPAHCFKRSVISRQGVLGSESEFFGILRDEK